MAITTTLGCSRAAPSDSGASAASIDAGTAGAASTITTSVTPPVRASFECATYLANSVKGASKAGLKFHAIEGTWGGTLAELTALPPGAQLCGTQFFTPGTESVGRSGELVNASIRSPLFGQQLRAFYDPILLTKLGCKLASDDSTPLQTRIRYKCPAGKGGAVTIATDTGAQEYGIGSVVP